MNQVMVAIVATRETMFFGHHDGALRQWIMMSVESRLSTSWQGVVTIEAGGEQVRASLQVEPGVHEYCCFAPVLWPSHSPEPKASVCLTLGSHTATATASVGYHRPWTIYLLSDVCTDYSWVYDSEAEFRADDAALTAAELDVAEKMAGEPEPNRNHYNFVHARETEFFLEHYPDRADQRGVDRRPDCRAGRQRSARMRGRAREPAHSSGIRERLAPPAGSSAPSLRLLRWSRRPARSWRAGCPRSS